MKKIMELYLVVTESQRGDEGIISRAVTVHTAAMASFLGVPIGTTILTPSFGYDENTARLALASALQVASPDQALRVLRFDGREDVTAQFGA